MYFLQKKALYYFEHQIPKCDTGTWRNIEYYCSDETLSVSVSVPGEPYLQVGHTPSQLSSQMNKLNKTCKYSWLSVMCLPFADP